MVRLPVGRIVLRILIGALCVSAAVASLAILLRREISDTDGNVILTSMLFALASAMAAAGYAVADRAKTLGVATVVAAAASFALFTIAIWNRGAGRGLLAPHRLPRDLRPRVGARRVRALAPARR
jgi:hypothetical protein